MMNTEEDDYLFMSGIQHFSFCRRQWAMIHVEQQWYENVKTAKGRVEHSRCHDEKAVEKRGNLLILRGLHVSSRRLHMAGNCDVVEFHQDLNGVMLDGYEGTWKAVPIEYKHGHSKSNDADRLQLTAEAMALEEMLVCDIPSGYLYYMETKRREEVFFTEELREKTILMAKEMNDYFHRHHTPKVKTGTFCNACSLKPLCLPKLCKALSVEDYIRNYIGDKA